MPPRARFRYIILLNLAPESFVGGGDGWQRVGPYFRKRALALQALNYFLILAGHRILDFNIRKVLVFRAGLDVDEEANSACFQQ